MGVIEFLRYGGLLHVVKHAASFVGRTVQRCLQVGQSTSGRSLTTQRKIKRDCVWIPPPPKW